jgi:hypothetical protein
LVVKLDATFKAETGRVLTKSVFLGVFLWACIHFSNWVFFGPAMALESVASNFVYGVILKHPLCFAQWVFPPHDNSPS